MKDSVFKAYDIRGIYPEEINEELAYDIGRAFAQFLQAKVIVVGRDMRVSSPALAQKIIEGITAEGTSVIDIGMCTTPMVSFAVASYNYDGGVMISASHNPGNYNAFKLIKSGPLQIDLDSGLEKIKQIIKEGRPVAKNQTGAITKKDILSDYLEHVLEQIGELKNLKIVVDYGNGVGSISAKPAYARLNLQVVELNATPDGTFPSHPANPHDAVNFTELKEVLLKEKADLGIFYDGDADRCVAVDDLGRVAPIDLVTVLLAGDELTGTEKNVYYDLRFSKSVPDQIRALGGNPVMMKVGNPVYKTALAEKGGALAAEFSGHVMFPQNYNIDDGLFCSLKIIKLLSEKKKKLSELIDTINLYSDSDEESYEAKHPETVYERIYAAFSEGKNVELDGAYVDLLDGFVSVRQSQNEPQLFRIRVEAKTKGDLDVRLNKVREIVRS